MVENGGLPGGEARSVRQGTAKWDRGWRWWWWVWRDGLINCADTVRENDGRFVKNSNSIF